MKLAFIQWKLNRFSSCQLPSLSLQTTEKIRSFVEKYLAESWIGWNSLQTWFVSDCHSNIDKWLEFASWCNANKWLIIKILPSAQVQPLNVIAKLHKFIAVVIHYKYTYRKKHFISKYIYLTSVQAFCLSWRFWPRKSSFKFGILRKFLSLAIETWIIHEWKLANCLWFFWLDIRIDSINL